MEIEINVLDELNKEELANYKLCINIDMIGVTIGFDIACCTANNSLVNLSEVIFGLK